MAGAWNGGRGLAQHLVAAGEVVCEVHPRWPALGRRSARRPGKSDPLDAHAVAVLGWREGAALPRVPADDATAVVDLLVTERAGALAEATRLRNQIPQLRLQRDPASRARLPNLQSQAGRVAVERDTASSASMLDQERARAVRRLAPRLRVART